MTTSPGVASSQQKRGLRRLGRFSQTTGLDPKAIVEKKRASPEGFDDFVLDYVTKSLEKGEKPAQVRNNLITLRSWLGHFGLKIDKKVKLPTSDYVDEAVPTKEQLAQIFRHCDPRARAIASLIAFCGLRPESIGNYVGSDFGWETCENSRLAPARSSSPRCQPSSW